jgi:hypothetical protein
MMLPDVDALLLRVATTAREKHAQEISAPSAVIRQVLEDEESTATGCFLAVREACGPPLNRDKILAAHTLTMVPAFWWEVNCFQNTVLAFNNILSNPEALQEATPGQLAWGVFEAEMIFGYADFPESPEFDREPALYTGACLHRAGYVLAPDLLRFAQDALDHFNKDKTSLEKNKVQDAWKKLQRTNLKDRKWKDDSPLDMQLARLASVNLYIEERAKQYQDDLTRLT